jgi:transcriptional regulator with XRE-family HTH domain
VSEVRSANAVDRRLGQRVRARRLEIGMSQERLAEILGITFQQVQKYEKGVNRIAASRLLAIATALDLSIGRMFEGISPPKGAGVAEDESALFNMALATPEGSKLLGLFASIDDPNVRRRVFDLVKVVAEEEATRR